MTWPSWEEILLKLLPLGVYEEISYDMANLFTAAVCQYPPARKAVEQMSIPQLQRFADGHAIAALNYDPHEPFHEVYQFVARLYELVETLLVTIIVFGLITGVGGWVTYSRDLLSSLGDGAQIFTTALLSGSAILAIASGLVLLYIRLLAFNTFFITVLNQELVIGPTKTSTRKTDKLVGYGMWNSSLTGGAGLKLLSVFSIFWILTAVIPRRDPYKYVKQAVRENLDLFADADGRINAINRAFNRMRAQRKEDIGIPGEESED